MDEGTAISCDSPRHTSLRCCCGNQRRTGQSPEPIRQKSTTKRLAGLRLRIQLRDTLEPQWILYLDARKRLHYSSSTAIQTDLASPVDEEKSCSISSGRQANCNELAGPLDSSPDIRRLQNEGALLRRPVSKLDLKMRRTRFRQQWRQWRLGDPKPIQGNHRTQDHQPCRHAASMEPGDDQPEGMVWKVSASQVIGGDGVTI